MCLQFCLSDYRPPLACSQKSLSLLRSIGGIRAFALLFFLTTDGVLKKILKYVVRADLPKAGVVTNEDKSISVDTFPEA